MPKILKENYVPNNSPQETSFYLCYRLCFTSLLSYVTTLKKKSTLLDDTIERQFSVILHSLLLKTASTLRCVQFCASAFVRVSAFTFMRPAGCIFLIYVDQKLYILRRCVSKFRRESENNEGLVATYCFKIRHMLIHHSLLILSGPHYA